MRGNMVLVSLISDQTIPNILVIKAFEAEKPLHLFVTTKEMEEKGKTAAILKVTGMSKKDYEILTIDQEQAGLAQSKIAYYQKQHQDDRFMVNLTGGTKLMALMMFRLFEQESSRYCYLPFGSDALIIIQQDFSYERKSITYNLSLYEYLKACGIFYNSLENRFFDDDGLQLVYDQFADSGFHYNAFPNRLATQLTKGAVSIENIAGTWFEEYVFSSIKNELNLKDEAIAKSVYIYQTKEQATNDQEIDLIFVQNNELHLVECKVSLGRNSSKARQKALKDLFKLAAIAHKFGLSTKLYFITFDSLRMTNGKHNEEFLLKCKLLKINNIADRHDLIKYDFSFKSFLTHKIPNV
ncbi:MAG: DUF1887 family protein [Bacteroidales bacterium]|jgi:hypothetical protein|nr:DUF1887 family protein [Bacteroidales bacterium]